MKDYKCGKRKLKWFKFCLHKAYLDQGRGVLNIVKYFIAIFGGGSIIATDGTSTFLVAGALFFYLLVCYFVGRYWYNGGVKEAENEVGNRFNLFVHEMRKKKTL